MSIRSHSDAMCVSVLTSVIRLTSLFVSRDVISEREGAARLLVPHLGRERALSEQVGARERTQEDMEDVLVRQLREL